MKWILAEDIVNWVATRPKDAQQSLPRFVKRLILAHGSAVQHIEMPDGEGTADHGWDGVVSFSGVSQFVPDGQSGWEIGTNRTIKPKADGDLDQRSKDSLGLMKAQTTFVFVTPRKWEKKASWIKEHRGKRGWKEIRALNARDLEEWFANAPAVSRDFALHIGKFAGSVRSLEEFWEEWSSATDPKISPGMLLAGREREAAQVREAMQCEGRITRIVAETVNEAIAFSYAAISAGDPIDGERALSTTLICESEESVRSAIHVSQGLTIIIPVALSELAGSIQGAGKSVVIADHFRAGNDTDGIILETPWRHDFETALREAGVPRELSVQLAAQSGASLSAFRRLRSASTSAVYDTWNPNDYAETMIPAVLAGQWIQRDGAADRDALEKLAPNKDAVSESRLRKLLAIEGAPLRNEGEVWTLTAPSDAFLAIGSHITSGHLKAFEEVALDVLGELDPRYELRPDKRYAAQVYGKSHRYSGAIRKGVAQTLCLIAARLSIVGGPDEAYRVNWIVEKLLEGITNHGWIGWASISDVSPALAEAAPDQYLNAVERTLQEDSDNFVTLLSDEDGYMGLGACLHAGLLWALETLAWFPEYLSRAAIILASLTEIDPGGRWANRPISSLTDVFLAWSQHSCASVEKRLATIDRIIAERPNVGWELLKGLGSRRFTSGTNQPKWRAVAPTEMKDDDYREYLNGLRDRYLTMGYADPSRLANLIGGEPHLPLEDRIKACKTVLSLDLGSTDGEARKTLRDTIRRQLYHIRSFRDLNEIDPDEISALEDAYTFLEPDDPIERHHWLFSSGWPELPSGEKRDHNKYDAKVRTARVEAAKEIFERSGLDHSVELALDEAVEGRFAFAIGQSIPSKLDDSFVDALGVAIGDQYPVPLVAYAASRMEKFGEAWIKQQIERIRKNDASSPKIVALALALPRNRTTWEYVETLGEQTNTLYWRWVSVWNVGEDTEFALNNLVEAGRILEAIDIAAVGKEHVTTATLLDLIRRLIVNLGNRDQPVNRNLFTFHLEELFDTLDNRSDAAPADIAQLEFPFAEMFRHSKRGLKAHDEILSENPAYFAELISWCFKPDSGEEEESGLTDEQFQNRARNTWTVLDALRFVPGHDENGFDPEKGAHWLSEIEQELSNRNRRQTGDHALAEVVRRTPIGEDDVWPMTELRKAIERLAASPRFGDALHTAFFNSRGVTSRSLDEGGAQERALAERYSKWADAIDVEAPRVAAILRRLADTYVRDGRRQDIEARLHRIED